MVTPTERGELYKIRFLVGGQLPFTHAERGGLGVCREVQDWHIL